MQQESDVKLLIIDDDPIYRKLVQKILRPWKIEIFSVRNVSQAKDLLQTQDFAICFIDGELGDGHGLDLISWMNQELVQLPRIAFISSGEYDNIDELKRDHPIEFFLSKPINRQEITQVVSAFLTDPSADIVEEPFLKQIRQEYEETIPDKLDRISQLINDLIELQSEPSAQNLKFELLRISENSVHYGYQRIHIIADQKCEEIDLKLKDWPPKPEWFSRQRFFYTQLVNAFQLRQFKSINNGFFSGEQLSASNPNLTYLVCPSQDDYPNIIRALQEAGSTIVWEPSPEAALRYLQEEHFDGALLICAPTFETSLLTGSELINKFQSSNLSSKTITILMSEETSVDDFKGNYRLQDNLDPIFLKEFFLQTLNPVVFEPWKILNLTQNNKINHIIESDNSLMVDLQESDEIPVVDQEWLKHPPRLICLNTNYEHLDWLHQMNQIAAMSYTSIWVFGATMGATPQYSNLEVCWFDEEQMRRPLLLPLLRQLIKLDHLHSAIHTQEEHTELYTRASFTELFQISYSRVRRSKQNLNLAIVDVHALHRLNQSNNFKESHEIVRQIGQFFKDQFRKTDIICRWHGSLFAFFFEGITPRTAQFIMQKLIQSYEDWDAPFIKDPESRMSIGISHFPEYGRDFSTLIENAMICLEVSQNSKTSKAVLSRDLADLDHYGQHQHKVLLLDSNEDVKTMLTYGFSLRGFDVKSMSSGTEALEFLRSRNEWGLPDLIILDRELPDMDGVDVLEAIHFERLCSAPVIFLSSKSTEEQILRGLKAGAADYFTKPFSMDIFIAKCQKFLGI